MSVVHWFKRPTTASQISAWAVVVARRCHTALAERLGESMHRMSFLEARGYIRARAAAVLDDEMEVLRQQTGCQPKYFPTVRRRATDEVIRLALGDLLKATRRSVPLRQAA